MQMTVVLGVAWTVYVSRTKSNERCLKMYRRQQVNEPDDVAALLAKVNENCVCVLFFILLNLYISGLRS